jgi:hypothetical protein
MSRLRIVAVSAALTLATAVSLLPMQVANAAPNTTVVLPSNNATLSGNQNLDAIASSGATQVQYELTGGSLSDQVIATATPTIVGWAAAWDTRTVANGTYSLNSVASYSGGVTATSAPVTITVNNAPPNTTVVFPASGTSLYEDQTYYIDAVASPGVTQVTITFTSQDSSIPGSLTISTTPTIWGWIGVLPGTPIPPGSSCGEFSVPSSMQSVASYAGGVSGTSAPVPVTSVDYYAIPPGVC